LLAFAFDPAFIVDSPDMLLFISSSASGPAL
jgi:hypothetical protein